MTFANAEPCWAACLSPLRHDVSFLSGPASSTLLHVPHTHARSADSCSGARVHTHIQCQACPHLHTHTLKQSHIHMFAFMPTHTPMHAHVLTRANMHMLTRVHPLPGGWWLPVSRGSCHEVRCRSRSARLTGGGVVASPPPLRSRVCVCIPCEAGLCHLPSFKPMPPTAAPAAVLHGTAGAGRC